MQEIKGGGNRVGQKQPLDHQADLISVRGKSGKSTLHKTDLTVSANPTGSSRAKAHHQGSSVLGRSGQVLVFPRSSVIGWEEHDGLSSRAQFQGVNGQRLSANDIPCSCTENLFLMGDPSGLSPQLPTNYSFFLSM